jgi:hypothetical protein
MESSTGRHQELVGADLHVAAEMALAAAKDLNDELTVVINSLPADAEEFRQARMAARRLLFLSGSLEAYALRAGLKRQEKTMRALMQGD